AGISGIVGRLFHGPARDEIRWRVAFLFGLAVGGVGLVFVLPEAFPTGAVRPVWLTAIAGVVVGFGTRLGNGCTSGHGVCGMGRLSGRSSVAVVTFMAAGIVTVLLTRMILESM
ncbi:MAG: YeeE/YedE thiosulfate transporter family protein, partial [Myxococcota bacterium]